jgi:SAM-dependent methyltransferase
MPSLHHDATLGVVGELERPQLEARTWEAETEVMLGRVGVQPGLACVDLGCGAMGILGPLSRRVGHPGRVVGVDPHRRQLAAARMYLAREGFANVTLRVGDPYQTHLPRASFDLVHPRFQFGLEGEPEQMLDEMLALVRPGGVIAIQESDATSWHCISAGKARERLIGLILAGRALRGGDFNFGQRIFGMVRRVGLDSVQVRAAVLDLTDGHPYMRAPIVHVSAMRKRIVGAGILGDDELDDVLWDCEQALLNPEAFVTTFLLDQAWGRTSEVTGRGPRVV